MTELAKRTRTTSPRVPRPWKVAPTATGWCFLAIAVIALFVPRPLKDGPDPRPFLGTAVVLVLLADTIALLVLRRGVHSAASVPRFLRCGEPAGIHVQLTGQSPRRANVRFLGQHELDDAGHTMVTLLPRQRGVFRIRELFLEVPSPFGLVRWSPPVDVRGDGLVCVGPFRTPSALARYEQQVRPGDEEPDRLRPYVAGDEIRRIDWRTSARSPQSMILLREAPRDHVHVVVDLGPEPGARAEHLASIAAGVLEELLLRGPVVVTSRDAQGLTTRTLTADAHIDAVLGSATTGAPVVTDGLTMYIGAQRTDLAALRGENVFVIAEGPEADIVIGAPDRRAGVLPYWTPGLVRVGEALER